MQFEHRLDEWLEESLAEDWTGTFPEYLALAIDNPWLARNSHARVNDMIRSQGTVSDSDVRLGRNIFEDSIFGLDSALNQLIRFFRSATSDTEMRKRILLLLGPPASGKASIVSLLKRGMERYSLTRYGATYAISGCPMHEEPLHLIPHGQRAGMALQYGLHIDGELCQSCQHSLKHDFGGDISRVGVRRVIFSQVNRVGFGSLVVNGVDDPDFPCLAGGIDISPIKDDRAESSNKAPRLNIDLEASNRGIMEFRQILRGGDNFLDFLVGLARERCVKLVGSESVSVDEVVVGYCNAEEYKAFISSRQGHPIVDRLIVVRVPYALQVGAEVNIYRKCLSQSFGEGAHVAPLSLQVVAALAVMTRLRPAPRGGGLPRTSILDKLNMFDGLVFPPYTQADVKRLHNRYHDGMTGVSPQYVVNALADVLAMDKKCFQPFDLLDSLVNRLDEWADLRGLRAKWVPNILGKAVEYYSELALRQVRLATVENFHARAGELMEEYIHNVRVCFESRRDEEHCQPDERLLRKIEGSIEVTDGERTQFRRQVLWDHDSCLEQAEIPNYSSIPVLGRALEEVLLPRPTETSYAMGAVNMDPDAGQKRADVQGRLIEEHGYCEMCAVDVYGFASTILDGKDPITFTRKYF
jgi:serine protein kinase